MLNIVAAGACRFWPTRHQQPACQDDAVACDALVLRAAAVPGKV